MKNWKIALSTADFSPSSAPILLNGDIVSNLVKANQMGYDALEVHTRENVSLDYDKIIDLSNSLNTKVCMIITGRLNTQAGGSLTSDDPAIVQFTMDGMQQYINMAQKLSADIVIGWVKGNIPENADRNIYLKRLADRLNELSSYAFSRNVKINLEVINRYEVNIFSNVDDTLDFFNLYPIENCYLHLDTFHMGIEENDPIEAIRKCKGRIGYVHLADNTRKYPGSGQFDFKKILQSLEDVGYDGYLSIECFPYPDSTTAAERAIAHIKGIIS